TIPNAVRRRPAARRFGPYSSRRRRASSWVSPRLDVSRRSTAASAESWCHVIAGRRYPGTPYLATMLRPARTAGSGVGARALLDLHQRPEQVAAGHDAE